MFPWGQTFQNSSKFIAVFVIFLSFSLFFEIFWWSRCCDVSWILFFPVVCALFYKINSIFSLSASMYCRLFISSRSCLRLFRLLCCSGSDVDTIKHLIMISIAHCSIFMHRVTGYSVWNSISYVASNNKLSLDTKIQNLTMQLLLSGNPCCWTTIFWSVCLWPSSFLSIDVANSTENSGDKWVRLEMQCISNVAISVIIIKIRQSLDFPSELSAIPHNTQGFWCPSSPKPLLE